MKMKSEKHYVEFIYPGHLFSDTSVKRIEDRDYTKIQLPDDCCGFRFFDRTEIEVDGETLRGERKNFSGVYYFGVVKTLDDVKKEKLGDILQRNMELNGWNEVVETRCGSYHELEKDDVVIGEKPE